MSSGWLFPTILGLALFQGFLGMGFQLVASRLLAPYFGTTLIVWAFLISSFIAAFSIGSFFGGSLSRLALAAVLQGAREMKDRGGFTWLRDTVPNRQLRSIFTTSPTRPSN